MLEWLEPAEKRWHEERFTKPWIASASCRPGRKEAPIASRFRKDRRPDRRVALGVRIEQQPRPVSGGHGARDEMGDGDRVVPHKWLILRRQRRFELGVDGAVDADHEAPHADARSHFDWEVEWL